MRLVFTPHLTPTIRGIHATLYARLTDPGVDLQALYERRYAGEPFVDIMPPGSMPDTRSVRASNMCRIAVHRPPGGDMALVLVVEDNLVFAVGVAAGSAKSHSAEPSSAEQPAAAAGSPLPVGTVVAALPQGCTKTLVDGVNYYSCGGNYYQPVYEGSTLKYITTKPK